MPRLAFLCCLLAALTSAAAPLTLTPLRVETPEEEGVDPPRVRMGWAYKKMAGGTVIAVAGGVAFGIAISLARQPTFFPGQNSVSVFVASAAGTAAVAFAAGMILVGLSRLMDSWDYARREEAFRTR